MHYDQARQRKDDDGKATGRWDWTTANDRTGIYPIGYCAGWITWTEAIAKRISLPVEQLRREQKQRDLPFKPKYHTEGHPTKDEAELCFYEYCLDRLVEFESSHWMACEVCAVATKTGLSSLGLDYIVSSVALCDRHRTVDTVRSLRPFRTGLEVWHS